MEVLDPNFIEFLESLNANGVEYAVGYHGFVRATGDLDVFVGCTRANAERLHAAFKHFGMDVPELSVAVFMEPGKIIRLGVPPVRLEVMNEISGVSFADCYRRRVQEAIAGVRINFIDRESLVLNKQAAGRPKDLADLAALQAKPNPDR